MRALVAFVVVVNSADSPSPGFVAALCATASAGFGCLFLDMPQAACVARDGARGRTEGAQTIARMALRFEPPGARAWERHTARVDGGASVPVLLWVVCAAAASEGGGESSHGRR